jgi:hypothetical protein
MLVLNKRSRSPSPQDALEPVRRRRRADDGAGDRSMPWGRGCSGGYAAFQSKARALDRRHVVVAPPSGASTRSGLCCDHTSVHRSKSGIHRKVMRFANAPVNVVQRINATSRHPAGARLAYRPTATELPAAGGALPAAPHRGVGAFGRTLNEPRGGSHRYRPRSIQTACGRLT